jgi:hypothetical protein
MLEMMFAIFKIATLQNLEVLLNINQFQKSV